MPPAYNKQLLCEEMTIALEELPRFLSKVGLARVIPFIVARGTPPQPPLARCAHSLLCSLAALLTRCSAHSHPLLIARSPTVLHGTPVVRLNDEERRDERRDERRFRPRRSPGAPSLRHRRHRHHRRRRPSRPSCRRPRERPRYPSCRRACSVHWAVAGVVVGMWTRGRGDP